MKPNIRTVEISPYVLAQGDVLAIGVETFDDGPAWVTHAQPWDVTTGRAMVRTGPTTTATGRLIESERTGQ